MMGFLGYFLLLILMWVGMDMGIGIRGFDCLYLDMCGMLGLCIVLLWEGERLLI